MRDFFKPSNFVAKHAMTPKARRVNNLYASALLVMVVFLLLTSGGCSSTPERDNTLQSRRFSHQPLQVDRNSLRNRLQKQYLAWKGVPYKEGGNNKRGVDCSGFVHLAFKNALGLNIPRSTALLLKTGRLVSRKQLSVGDLVFFKTGGSKQHVGIYIGKNQFIHASSSKGVIKSNLRSSYWSRHYWKSRRVLNI
jgi:hypothetical protein